jgi:hypothetical protein
MNNIEVTIRFGVGNGIVKSFPRGTTIGQILNDAQVRQALGYPATNIRALIGRVSQDLNSVAQNSDVIEIETVGTAKA